MFSTINLLLAFLWLISATADYADYCYIWQLKEYRIDRMRDFLSTEQGKKYIKKYQMLWRSLLVLIVSFWPINDTLYLKHVLIVFFVIDFLHVVVKFLIKQTKHPKFTKKAIIIMLGSILFEGLLFLLIRDWMVLLLLLVLRFSIISGLILGANLFTERLKTIYIKKATKKLAEHKNLKVIGITGSYGKTTVKNFLNHILNDSFKVITTPEHTNTDIGTAKMILRTDFSDKEIFIVEMGAYKIGEIKKICDMVKPQMGILTAINEQHLSLFGGIQNTQKAKFELLQALPNDGLAVVNSDNAYCREKIPELKTNVSTFGTDADFKPTLLIRDIKSSLRGLVCKGEIDGEERIVESPVIGEYNAMNVAPCFLIALNLGMTPEKIIERIGTLSGGLRILKYGDSDIIDDNYNSNPDGFHAALDILNKFASERKRIVITRGMLELGEKSDELHYKIAEEISLVADELAVITPDFAQILKEGMLDKFRTKFILIDNPEKLLEYVKKSKNTNDVILVENRIPKIIAKELGL